MHLISTARRVPAYATFVFVVLTSLFALRSAGQCPAGIAISMGSTTVNAGSGTTVTVSISGAYSAPLRIELVSVTNAWTLSSFSNPNVSSFYNGANQVLKITTGGVTSFAFSLSPGCPASGFNAATSNTFHFYHLNDTASATACNTNNSNGDVVFHVGFPHLQFLIAEPVPATYSSALLGGLYAMKHHYYMREVDLVNNGTADYNFSSGAYSSLTIHNSYATSSGSPQFTVLGIMKSIPAGFANGFSAAPSGYLSIGTITNNTVAHYYQYTIDSTVIDSIGGSGHLLHAPDTLKYYEVIRIDVCDNTLPFYTSSMNYVWHYNGCFTDSGICAGGPSCQAGFSRQQNDPDVELDNAHTTVSVAPGSHLYCYNGQGTLYTLSLHNQHNQSQAGDLTVDLTRDKLGFSNVGFYTDMDSITAIHWYDGSGSALATWNLSGITGILGTGVLRDSFFAVSTNTLYRVKIVRINDPSIVASACNAGLNPVDRYLFDFTPGSNPGYENGNLYLMGHSAGASVFSHLTFAYSTYTCKPEECIESCDTTVAMGHNWDVNALYYGNCAGDSATLFNLYPTRGISVYNANDPVYGAAAIVPFREPTPRSPERAASSSADIPTCSAHPPLMGPLPAPVRVSCTEVHTFRACSLTGEPPPGRGTTRARP